MKKTINRVIAVLFLIMILVLAAGTDWRRTWPGMLLAFLLAVLHLIWAAKEAKGGAGGSHVSASGSPCAPEAALTEVCLLGEDGSRLASWNIYGKNGIVIGRDIGENHVTVNLDQSAYASMIDIEHAVLNYSGGSWYIEDISEKNGVSIQKQDGRKYKLSYGKPCRLERGDIIYVALARLLIQ